MKPRMTLALFLITALLSLYVFSCERPRRLRAQTPPARWELDGDRVAYLRVQSAQLDVEFDRTADGWQLRHPVSARADATVVRGLIDALEALAREAPTSVALDLNLCGLAPPAWRVTWGADAWRQTLAIGRRLPLEERYYARLEDRTEVFTIPAGFPTGLPAELAAYRNRELFADARGSVRRLGLNRPDGFVQLALDDKGQWLIQQPLEARANPDAVRALLEQLLAARIGDFVAEGVRDAAAYGLAAPELEVSIWIGAEAEARTLQLGRRVESNPAWCYAKHARANSIWAVPATLHDTLRIPVDDLRDRTVLPAHPTEWRIIEIEQNGKILRLERDAQAWRLTAPRAARAAAQPVEALMAAWAGTPALGFQAPPEQPLPAPWILRVTLAARNGEPAKQNLLPPIVLAIWPAPDSEQVLVKRNNESTLYRVPGDWLRTLSVEPFIYQDRSVLRIAPAEVRRLALEKKGTKQMVKRAPGEPFFISADDLDTRVDRSVIEDILAQAERLDALNWVTERPGDLAQYGLETPFATLTFGLSGESAIGRTLMVGKEAPDGSIYAMIQGQDVIFLLDPAVVHLLTRDFFLPALPTNMHPAAAAEL